MPKEKKFEYKGKLYSVGEKLPDGGVMGRSGTVLKPFEKGKSGNPAGRPKGAQSMRDVIRQMLDTDMKYYSLESMGNRIKSKKKMKAAEAVATALLARAIHKGDVNAIRTILSHVDGDKLLVGGDEENQTPIQFEDKTTLDTTKLTTKQLLALRKAMKAPDATDPS